MEEQSSVPDPAGQAGSAGPMIPSSAFIEDPHGKFDRELVEAFLASPRWRPAKPAHFNDSVVILRGSIVPHYHAVYDHLAGRYVELRYPLADGRSWRSVALPLDRAPQLIDRHRQPHIRPRGAFRKHGPSDGTDTAARAEGGEQP